MIELLFDSATVDPIGLKDYFLGFFMALALRRGRITAILDRFFPKQDDTTHTEQTEPRDSSDGATTNDDQ